MRSNNNTLKKKQFGWISYFVYWPVGYWSGWGHRSTHSRCPPEVFLQSWVLGHLPNVFPVLICATRKHTYIKYMYETHCFLPVFTENTLLWKYLFVALDFKSILGSCDHFSSLFTCGSLFCLFSCRCMMQQCQWFHNVSDWWRVVARQKTQQQQSSCKM